MKLTKEQFEEHSRLIKEGQTKTNKKLGRPLKIKASKKEVIEMRKSNAVREIAKFLGVSIQTVYDFTK